MESSEKEEEVVCHRHGLAMDDGASVSRSHREFDLSRIGRDFADIAGWRQGRSRIECFHCISVGLEEAM